MKAHRHSLFLRITWKLLQWCLGGFMGLAIAFLLTTIFSTGGWFGWLGWHLAIWLFRCGLILLYLVGCAIILESLR